jgi:hypothetical protein
MNVISIEPGAYEHRAIPTRGNDTFHPGEHRNQCERCCAEAARLTREHAPRARSHYNLSGDDSEVLIRVGDAVHLKPEGRFSSTPEWVTITALRLNSYTGEVWMHSFAAGESLVITDDMISEVKPWE